MKTCLYYNEDKNIMDNNGIDTENIEFHIDETFFKVLCYPFMYWIIWAVVYFILNTYVLRKYAYSDLYQGAVGDFYKSKDLKSAIYDEHSNSKSNIHCYKIGSETKAEEVKAVDNCRIEQDSSGRYINISIPDGTGNLVTYALTTETATDQEKYQDAMNQYEYEKYQYDQAIQEINAKIEIVQSEDKALELRLKQLDTEQKAISTELEAVGQVIQKNTESSFKTFG